MVNIYAENTANKFQNRAGRDFFGGVQPVGHEKSFQKHISQHVLPSTYENCFTDIFISDIH